MTVIHAAKPQDFNLISFPYWIVKIITFYDPLLIIHLYDRRDVQPCIFPPLIKYLIFESSLYIGQLLCQFSFLS